MPQQVLSVTEDAMKAVREALQSEKDGDDLGLWIEVVGANGKSYVYDLYFGPVSDAGDGDVVQHIGEDGDVPVVIPYGSLERLEGARLEWSDEGDAGLVMVNPNSPVDEARLPEGVVEGDFSSELATKVLKVIEEELNPSIAMHGGAAELVAVGEATVYVRLTGGCQGCGLAAITLSQGIEVAIKQAVPEIRQVIDLTNHALGDNPYYQSSKK